ncbi:hypothetical protein CEUSTIGMA_g2306.t1 [Chlamydomonas eustigma]|uniref:Uncharacterized protein n=1 Tax=Chlamydomonas eustigma TaxID=1157962 RepID=A0A250WWF2_9CHLO|nr:hypothetical protein CEUSTIGMA_g2306.t1 [Chlamydomonas eustigma]|eukprot:GAX74860.1 hypothetical protein CEUSTIGMA_g2306.t1 [Chlamydomonas eustigma]
MQFDSLSEDKPGIWRKNGQAGDKTALQAWKADGKPMTDLKDRKRRYLAAQEAQKRRPINRPGKKAEGAMDRTLGIADIADRLEEYNGGGYRPKDTDILKILLKCPTNTMGRVKESDWELVLAAWNNRPTIEEESKEEAKSRKPKTAITPLMDTGSNALNSATNSTDPVHVSNNDEASCSTAAAPNGSADPAAVDDHHIGLIAAPSKKNYCCVIS